MYPLLITMLFLSLLSILTTSKLTSFVHTSLESSLAKNYIHSRSHLKTLVTEAQFADHLFEEAEGSQSSKAEEEESNDSLPPKKKEKKGDGGSKHPVSLGVNLVRPPNNSRINLAFLMHDSLPKKETLSPYEITARLLRKLYGTYVVFQEISDIEYRLLNRLMTKKELMKEFTTPDELSKISLDDPFLQEVFYFIMKGSASIHDGTGYPSFLHYITWDAPKENRKPSFKINLMYASIEILEVIFEDTIAQELQKMRGEIWKEILIQEEKRLEMNYEEGLNRTKITKMLSSKFKDILTNFGKNPSSYFHLFDFHLGHPGNVLFIKDETTALILREKL